MKDEEVLKQYDLKKGVDFIGITCTFFCHDGKGNLLMHKRSKNCRDEVGRWDCGSGSMEFGEKSFRKAALREIYEEYRIKPRDLKLCGVTNVIRKNGKQKTHWVCFIFSACVNPERAKVGEPHKMEELRLFPAKKLPKPLHSMLKKHLAVVRRAGVNI